MILASLVFVPAATASEAQRKISSDIEESSAVIYKYPGRVYDIEVIATSNAGYAILFDLDVREDGTVNITGAKAVSEIREATAYNSKHVSFGESGIKFDKGIYLYLLNATAIVHYR